MTTHEQPVTNPDFDVVPAGDSTLLVELADRIDATVNEAAILIARAIKTSRFPGVRDVTSTFRSVPFTSIHCAPTIRRSSRVLQQRRRIPRGSDGQARDSTG